MSINSGDRWASGIFNGSNKEYWIPKGELKKNVCLFNYDKIEKNVIYYCGVSFDGKEFYVFKDDNPTVNNFVGIYRKEYFVSLSEFRKNRIDDILNED